MVKQPDTVNIKYLMTMCLSWLYDIIRHDPYVFFAYASKQDRTTSDIYNLCSAKFTLLTHVMFGAAIVTAAGDCTSRLLINIRLLEVGWRGWGGTLINYWPLSPNWRYNWWQDWTALGGVLVSIGSAYAVFFYNERSPAVQLDAEITRRVIFQTSAITQAYFCG